MGKYLKKFETEADYQAFKDSDEWIIPNVSAIYDAGEVFYKSHFVRPVEPEIPEEPEVVLHPVIHAKFNATSENMTAFKATNQIKSLKIDDNVIEFEPPVSETVVIEALGSEITINSDQSGVFPSEYLRTYSNLVIKPTDTTLKCTDFEYVAVLVEAQGTQMSTPLPIADIIDAGYLTYNESTDSFSVTDFASLIGSETAGCVFITFNENTGEINAIDTTCTFTTISGGLESPYMFETEGEHEVEIELVDNANMVGIFTETCVTEISYMKDVVSINYYAFYDCESLTSITIPNSVTSIGESAFYNCDSLTSVTIPNSVTSIGQYAFYNCQSLTEIAIPNGVPSIGNYTFYNCTSLTEITIPDSVTLIDYNAFTHCSNLTSVYCNATTPPTGGSFMFDSNIEGRKIYVPMNSVDAYKSADGWSNYANDIVAM